MAPSVRKRASTRKTRGINADGTVDSRLAPVGEVKDALKSEIPTIDAPKPGEEAEERDTSKNPPVTSLAELKVWHRNRGTAPTREEVDNVRELENKVLEEGGKKLRTNTQE